MSSGDVMSKIRSAAAESARELEEIRKNAQGVLEDIRQGVARHVVNEAEGGFGKVAKSHRISQNVWLVLFVLSVVVTGLVLIWSIASYEVSDELGRNVGGFLQRALAITLPAILMRVCLAKFNIERHLHVVYKHRAVVLETYRIFQGTIAEDDHDAKNQFRLEIARVVFSSPETGYAKASSASEINFSPVVGPIEKVAKAS